MNLQAGDKITVRVGGMVERGTVESFGDNIVNYRTDHDTAVWCYPQEIETVNDHTREN